MRRSKGLLPSLIRVEAFAYALVRPELFLLELAFIASENLLWKLGRMKEKCVLFADLYTHRYLWRWVLI